MRELALVFAVSNSFRDSIEATERLNRRGGANQTDRRRSKLVARGAPAARIRFVMLRLALKHIKRFRHLLHRMVDLREKRWLL